MKKGYEDIFEQMGLTPEECYLKQKNEIEMLKTQSTANYLHHKDSKKEVMEFFDGLLECSQTKSQREYLQSIKDNIEEIIDENLNSQNYYEN
jgi:5'-deoxynucleotidase YfbR-like HD superfamily hydrolase